MADRNNTIAGWVLGAGIVALGLSIVSGKYFQADKPHRPHQMGFEIEGVVAEESGDSGPSLATLLASADPAAGEKLFASCSACHTANKGGANGNGPNIYGILGKPHGHLSNFPYSDALKSVSGPWTFEGMDAWLKSPRKYANGTKMTFNGMSKPEDRANLIAWLNQQSDSPLPLPAAPAEDEAAAEGDGAAAEGEAAEGEGAENGAEKAAEGEAKDGAAKAEKADKAG